MTESLEEAALQHRIRTRAYEIYEAKGKRHGRALEDWLEAEREITREIGTLVERGQSESA